MNTKDEIQGMNYVLYGSMTTKHTAYKAMFKLYLKRPWAATRVTKTNTINVWRNTQKSINLSQTISID